MTVLPSISTLMSPPEPKSLDSFSMTPEKTPSSADRPFLPTSNRDRQPFVMAKPMTPEQKRRTLPSPPISPWTNKQNQLGQEGYNGALTTGNHNTLTRDPVLFDDTKPAGMDEQPLFPAEHAKSTEDIISNHMAMHLVQFKNKLNRPTRDEYRLAISCVSTVMKHYHKDPVAYLKRQREEVEEMYWQSKRVCGAPGVGSIARPAPVAIAPAPRPGKRMIKPASPKVALPRAKRTPKTSPIAKLMNYPAKGRSSQTPERMPGAKREDVDYNTLPNYCPPTDTLPNNAKALKADWPSSNVLNLSNDPDREQLHESEVNLAATLRLSCATYLCSKRRIFEARLKALRIGKEFRKTDAQQACKIDVNKASKLWTAYDRVGWFKPEYFQQLL